MLETMNKNSKATDSSYWTNDIEFHLSAAIRFRRMKNGAHSGQTIFLIPRNNNSIKIEFVDTTGKYLNRFLIRCTKNEINVSFPDGDENSSVSFCVSTNDTESHLKFFHVLNSILCIKEIEDDILNFFSRKSQGDVSMILGKLNLFSTLTHEWTDQESLSSEEDPNDPFRPDF